MDSAGETGILATRNAAGGFTLIEILTVMGIIALLVSMILGAGVLARQKAQRAKAMTEIQKMHGALQEYKLQYKRFGAAGIWAGYPYPTTAGQDATGLKGTAVTNWLPQGFAFKDPWQRPYQYLYTAGEEVYQLYSEGPDGRGGTEDDIRSGR
jgi:general secretion pathway protein G